MPGIFREGMSTSLAAQIGVAPIIFFFFGQFNPFSFLINALVLWTIAPMTILAGLAAILVLISESLARLSLILVYPLTSWFIWVIEFLG